MKWISAALIPLLIFLFTVEIVLRWYTQRHIIYDIEMTRYARSLKVRSANPEIGHEHRPLSRARLMGVDVSINSGGFRGREYAKEKKPGTYRFIFLGDSLTLGWGVREEKIFPALLEKRLSREIPVEVLNFGTGNYNTAQEVELFFEKGIGYDPDGVAIFFFINDLEPVPRMSKWEFLGGIRFVTFFWSKLRNIASKMTGSDYGSYYASLYKADSPQWAKYTASMERMRRYCAENGKDLVVVLLPELHELKNYPFRKQYAQVASLLERSGIACADLAADFKAIENPKQLWVAPDDAHPNELAHELIAQYAYPAISRIMAHERSPR